ncbi:FG-GAP repeat protein [Microbulbifer celer]|uniref:FG-GAP repeat protein n=1 Tax=Microbulbifer celer TaxID=435905 RepID=A0ABW3U4R0_9GAMM|nr:FG-GAP repeat protein [Microbulbifer celer]UFN56752.1 FG-GAP repeat protein [Microbulbifer celer]
MDEYTLLENVDGKSGYESVAIIEGDASEHDMSVFLPEKINASYMLEACNEYGCVESESIAVSGSLAEAVGYFKASNAEGGVQGDNSQPGDQFGYAVALSADGATMAVGARYEFGSSTGVNGDESDNGANFAGAVYVFRKSERHWAQEAYLKASNTDLGDRFGYSVALSTDGSVLAVSAPWEDSDAQDVDGDQYADGESSSDPGYDSGAVYVYTRESESWSQQAYIKSSNSGKSDNFGVSVSLSGEGTILAVGASGEASSATGIDADQSNDDQYGSGAVYIFENIVGNWDQRSYIKASNTMRGSRFGEFLALSHDGKTLAVGAPHERNLSGGGINGDQYGDLDAVVFGGWGVGAVYVFAHNDAAWKQEAYIKAPYPDSNDGFGASLDLAADGDTLVVGFPGDDSGFYGEEDSEDNSLENSGSVYVYGRLDGAWRQSAYLAASNPDEFDFFGGAVSISNDGTLLAVSAFGESSSATGIGGDQHEDDIHNAGAAYLFKKRQEAWFQASYIKSSNPSEGQRFGARGAVLAADGKTVAISTIEETSTSTGINGNQHASPAKNVGAVYLY